MTELASDPSRTGPARPEPAGPEPAGTGRPSLVNDLTGEVTGPVERHRNGRIGAQVAVVATGALATAGLALGGDRGAPEAARVVLIAGLASVGVGLVGAAILNRLRSQTLRVQVVAVSLVSVAAVAGGISAAAQAMFITSRDLRTLIVVLMAAATVATSLALVLGGRIVAGTRLVGSAARAIGADAEPPDPRERAAPGELAVLAAELDDIRRSLDAARSRERVLEESRRELVAWVSHDLRTPLAGLRATVEALEDGVISDPDDVAQALRTMNREVDRLSGLVTDLFELSRIQSGTLRLSPTRVSVADLVSDVISGAAPVAAASGVQLHGVPAGIDPPEADVSVPELLRALRNVVDNAIRHTPTAGAVRLAVGVDDGHAVVAVQDECGGIPAEELPRVFDVAFSGDAARSPHPSTTTGGGAGLGLSIARGIVEAHHGVVDVRNEGPGCRVTLRLPLAAGPAVEVVG